MQARWSNCSLEAVTKPVAAGLVPARDRPQGPGLPASSQLLARDQRRFCDSLQEAATRPIAAGLVYNKHVVNSLQIEGNSNADNQTMEFQVTRRVYGVGDSFGVSSAMYYMSDIFSGFGDEGACIINAESIGILDAFHSTVEAIDWAKDKIVYAPGRTMPHTLSPSRPLINMNREKWATAGRVWIVRPSGTWRGKSYPNRPRRPQQLVRLRGRRHHRPLLCRHRTGPGDSRHRLVTDPLTRALPCLDDRSAF